MICLIQPLLEILPAAVQNNLTEIELGSLRQIRLFAGRYGCLGTDQGERNVLYRCNEKELRDILNKAARYSPWAQNTLTQGYLTLEGGHRIGVCGDVIVNHGCISGYRRIDSLCIRVAKDFPGISEGLPLPRKNTLLLGPPGSGKTTYLRDLARRLAASGECVGVVDERGELFPERADFFKEGINVLRNVDKESGMEMLLRTMGTTWIVIDEITGRKDCMACRESAFRGARILATIHADSREDLINNALYHQMDLSKLFSDVITLKMERWGASA